MSGRKKVERTGCHRCKYAAQIEKLRGICANCSIDKECARFPRETVSLNAMPNPSGIIASQGGVKPPVRSCDEQVTHLPPAVEMRLRDELAGFLRLSFLNQMLLVWILRGESLSEFGRMEWLDIQGRGKSRGKCLISPQAAHERLGTLKKQMPDLVGVIEQMVALNSGNRGSRKKTR